MKRGRKGQITLFVILALVILISVGLAVYYYGGSKENSFTKPNIEIDEKFSPVQNFVQQCMNQILIDGVVKLGQHGGYINPRDPYITGSLLDLNPLVQYDSDALFLSRSEINSSVVYWVYGDSSSQCDNCVVTSLTPTINEMEEQLNRYIEKNLASCLKNYDVFNDQGFLTIDSKNYSVKTSISDAGVAAILETDVYIKINNDEGKLNIFYTETDIPLKRYYDMATIITFSEIDTNYLENVMLYLIDMHSGLDSSKLPPFYDFSTGYSVVYWSKVSIRKNIESLLSSYISVLRISNTKNDITIPMTKLSPSEKYFYNSTRLDIFEGLNLSTTEISFSYVGQDIYMKLSPSDGELVTPSTYTPEDFTDAFRGRTINSYNFHYDLSYPVLVEIHEEYKPGSTYTFMFGMEATIINNLKVRDFYNSSISPIYWEKDALSSTINPPDISNVNLATMGFTGRQPTFDLSEAQKESDSRFKLSTTKSRFCDKNRRTSENVMFRLYDSVTEKPVTNVNVEFTCGNYVKCDLEQVIYNSSLRESSFNQKLPVCVNGYIKLSRQGYISENIILSTDSGTKQNFGAIYMDPIIEKEFDIQTYNVLAQEIYGSEDRVYSLSNFSENITENDSVTISLEKIPYEKTDEPYTVTAIISKEYGALDKHIRLAPGVYSLKIQLIDSEGIVIPKLCQRICVDGPSDVGAFFGSDCSEYDYIPKDDIEIKPAPWGGIDYTNRTLVHISPDDLASDKILEFNILKLPKPSCFNDMKVADEIEPLSIKYKNILLPQFVNATDNATNLG